LLQPVIRLSVPASPAAKTAFLGLIAFALLAVRFSPNWVEFAQAAR